LSQIEEISQRTTDGLGIRVAYDNETSYPYWWYLRNYPNAQYYGTNPSRALRDAPVILVGDANFGKIEPVVGNLYDRFDYIRLWWPNQDYYDLTWERIRDAFTNPDLRQALFEIWLNRDYTAYGRALGRDMSLPNWTPAARMRLYIRKDITSQLWNYGSAPAAEVTSADPFDEKYVKLNAAQILGMGGAQPGQFARPHDIAIAPDGSLYVTDTENNRIQHLSPTGEALHVWGMFGDVATGPTDGGIFNQPWGIALGPDGSVYVADTWNHRIQKFTADGQFIKMWGYFGQGEAPEAFWGPRDVAVDAKGRVYVTDTGNKRVVVFDADGAPLTQFGEAGLDPGQFDEPVGLAIDADGLVYVADTWNQRIQVFQESAENQFTPFRSWEVQAWYGQSLDNKPFIAVGNGSVFIADPEGYRILQFTASGEAVRAWGDFGTGSDTFGLPASVAIAPDGAVWVVDAANARLMRFELPAQ
jgi:sugar lactone lactonase YvrE